MICDSCNRDFKRIGSHWSQSSCGYPSFSELQKDLLTGLLMGDGTVEKDYGTGRMTVEMTSKPFLKWVDEEFGKFSTGVSLKYTAEEKASQAKEDPFFSTVNEENWSATYVLKTRRHPYIAELRDWYSSGEKRFPENLTLTPMITKAWYCGDGSLQRTKTNPNQESPRAKFITRNEDDRIKFIQSLFTSKGFDARIRENGVTLTVPATKKLCDWMGKAPPSMEYKWV